MSMNRYRQWAEVTGVKAVKTTAQSLVALIGASSVGVLSLPWGEYLGIAVMAGVVCVLHNITSLPDPKPTKHAKVDVPTTWMKIPPPQDQVFVGGPEPKKPEAKP